MERRDFLRMAGGLAGLLVSPFILMGQEPLREIIKTPTLARPREGLEPVPESKFDIVLCNSFIDFDNDARFLFPLECLGIKNNFGVAESLVLVAQSDVYQQTGKQLSIDIYDGRGRRAHSHSQFLTAPHLTITQGGLMQILRDNGIGNYAAVATLNGELVGKKEFGIGPVGDIPMKLGYAEKGFELFACNWDRDLNNNGLYEKEDFSGIKDEFNSDERLEIVGYSRIPGQTGKTLSIRVYNSDGNVLYRTSSYLGSDALAVTSRDIMPQVSQWGGGMYTAIATLGQEKSGKLVGRKDFEVRVPVNNGPTFHYEVYPVIPEPEKDCGCRK